MPDPDRLRGLAALDGQVRDFMNRCEAGADIVAGHALPAYDADDRGVGFRTDAPDMKIGDTRVAWRLDQHAHFLLYMMIGRIEQHGRRVAHQRP